LTLTVISELFREVFFSIQFSECQFGFTLAAISELTREVFLPDQSAAHTKSSNNRWQAQSHKNSVEICAYLWKKFSNTGTQQVPPGHAPAQSSPIFFA